MKYITLITLLLIHLLSPSSAFAAPNCPYAPAPNTQLLCYGDVCTSHRQCPSDSRCEKQPAGNYQCGAKVTGIGAVFGKILPPAEVESLGIGSIGISRFLNNVITLIYITASVVFVFLILMSGFQWLTSAGDKEAIATAQKRITYALIGIGVLALAFAAINILQTFTGFSFF